MTHATSSRALGRLFDLDLPDDFLTRCYGHRPCHLGASRATSVFGWDALNRLLRNQRLYPPRLQINHSQSAVIGSAPFQSWSGTGEAIGLPKLRLAAIRQALARGATLIVNSLEDMDDEVRNRAKDLSNIVRDPVGANCYASMGKDANFGPHWDDHDVFVLQLAGTKRWQLFAERFGGDDRGATLGKSWWEGELQPGDMVYLPRGAWHAVAGTGTPSLHLTFGVRRLRSIDLLKARLDKVGEDPWWEDEVPRFADLGTQQAFEQGFSERLAALGRDPPTLDAMLDDADAVAALPVSANLPWAINGSAIDGDYRIVWRAARAKIDRAHDGSAILRAGGGEVNIRADWMPAIDRLIAEPLKVAELAEQLGGDRDAATALAQTLAAWGLVELLSA